MIADNFIKRYGNLKPLDDGSEGGLFYCPKTINEGIKHPISKENGSTMTAYMMGMQAMAHQVNMVESVNGGFIGRLSSLYNRLNSTVLEKEIFSKKRCDEYNVGRTGNEIAKTWTGPDSFKNLHVWLSKLDVEERRCFNEFIWNVSDYKIK